MATAVTPSASQGALSPNGIRLMIDEKVKQHRDGRDRSRIASNVHLWINKRYLLEHEVIQTWLEPMLLDSLESHGIHLNDDRVTVHILPESTAQNELYRFDITLEWNTAVPDRVLQFLLGRGKSLETVLGPFLNEIKSIQESSR